MSQRDEFMRLTEQEPALLELVKRVRAFKRAARDRTEVCGNRIWYDHIKPPLERLVGWSAGNRALRTSVAYGTACLYLYELLPNCRNCCCVKMGVRIKPSRAAQRLSAQLGGPYVHFLKNGQVSQQGLIVEHQGSVVQVLHFEWLMGEPSNTRWYRLDEIQHCRLYRDADTWRAAAAMDQSTA
jgi:hypothetical protein